MHRRRGKQTFQGFCLMLMEGKKLFFEPIYKSPGIEKKKILKAISALKEDCQTFGLLTKKAEKLVERFKYPM